jgi:hypothetical protein
MIPWADLQNVGCGECTVLGGQDSILMVDCGSLNTIIPGTEWNFREFVTQSLTAHYCGVPHRAFLLSHFHRDHSCGLWDILKSRPDYFEEIYLPCSPCDGRGLPLLLEFALFAYVFLPRQGYCGQVSTGALKAFSRVLDHAQACSAYALGQGDTFENGGIRYECVWPPREDFPFDRAFTDVVEALHRCAQAPQPGEDLLRQFLDLLYTFCNAYLVMCESFPVQRADADRTRSVLEQMDGLAPLLQCLPAAAELRSLLENRTARELYSRQTNAASLMVQSSSGGSGGVLMTGDATPEALAAAEPLLYHDYYLLKAPHHGLPGSVGPTVAGLSAAHILISCGERIPGWRADAGWAALPGRKHCTAPVCAAFAGAGCCNRTALCWDFGGLALRCPGNRGGEPPCGIRVAGRGCLCDER